MLRAASLLLGISTLLPAASPVTPREVPWTRAKERFDVAWILPDARVPAGEETVDLLAAMKALHAQRFPAKSDADVPAWTQSFGDILQALRADGTGDAAAIRRMRKLRAARPDVWKQVRTWLPQLVRDDLLTSGDWDPDDDEDDDGVFMGEPFDRDDLSAPAWRKPGGTSDVHQAACLMWCDLAALKEAENDYAAYPDHVGADYDEIWAFPDSYVCGVDEDQRPFSALKIRFVQDLPFPYSNFRCDLSILNRVDDDGHVRCDIHSKSSDFYWLAGQDAYLPVRASDGAFVALLVVRVYGFDLRSVPDGDGARQTALRGSLGNLKRRAEALYAARGGEPICVDGDVPRVPLSGVKTK